MAYPLKLQCSWLKEEWDSTISSFPVGKKFINAVVVKNFVKQLHTRTTPILYVDRFVKITPDFSVIVIFSDSKHLVHGIIPYEVCKDFEYRYGKRITFEMTGTTILLKNANFQFATSQQLHDMGMSDKSSIITIVVKDLDVFQADQVELSWLVKKDLQFLYEKCEQGRGEPESEDEVVSS